MSDASFSAYRVADIGLADFGRREISLAEAEMPALMALRRKYAEERRHQRRDHDGRAQAARVVRTWSLRLEFTDQSPRLTGHVERQRQQAVVNRGSVGEFL